MKYKSLIIAAVVLAGTGGLYAFQSPPAVTITPTVPSTVYVNATTTVTITAQITDSRVVTNGVNLLQVDPITGTQTVAGTLMSQGGGMFSISIQPNTAAPQLFSYEISAAFRGLLKRSLSSPITVAVAPAGIVLPPDPGPAGLLTLAGVDSDHDGVRDDVERWIAVTQPLSQRLQMALTQEAQAIQNVVLSGGNGSTAVAAGYSESNALICLSGIELGIIPAEALSDQLHSIVLNTPTRIHAYLAANSLMGGTAYTLPSIASRTSLCSFNPTALPN